MTGTRDAAGVDAQLQRLRPDLAVQLDGIPDYRPGDVDLIRATMAGAFGSPLPPPDDVVLIGATDGRRVELRLHHPADVPHGALLHVHGGGFVMGSAALYDGVCSELAEATGCIIAAVDYRLAPEHPYPAALDDCMLAWEWLAAHSETLGVDETRVGLYGESAGAALAIGVADRLRSSGALQAAALVLQEPVVDDRLSSASSRRFNRTPIWNRELAEWSWNLYLGDVRASPPGEASPARLADFTGFPPTFVSTRDLDPLRDEGIALARRLIDDGIDVELRHYAGTLHGTLGLTGAPVRERILRDAVEFVIERLGRSHGS